MHCSRRIHCLMFLLLVFTTLPAGAKAAADELVVATRHVPPFAVKGADGEWQGISIELWRDIAGRMGVKYRFREMKLQAMLDALAAGEVDAAAAALTITAAREERMDFSHPFLSAGLGIAVPLTTTGGGWLALTQRIVSGDFLGVVAALLGLLLLVGLLVWLAERRANRQFGGSPAQGIGSGMWWSAVTMTTVGYGDKAPQTLAGRGVAVVWMFASIIIISSFTAAIATALTVGELGGKVRGVEDLPRARLATVAASTSSEFAQGARYDFRSLPDLEQALDTVASGRVDAAIYDAPILRYRVLQGYTDRLAVLPGSFERQDYGIALPQGSVFREALNRALLERISEPDWEQVMHRYLGNRG